MTPLLLLVLFVAAAAVAIAAAGGRADSSQPETYRQSGESPMTADPLADPLLVKQIRYWHRLAVKRLRLLGARERKIVRLQRRLRGVTRQRRPSLAVPHYSAWLCIHSHEGAWNDSGDPYWGGLQMDRSFMMAYAPRWLLARGFANVWTPREQMYVAERAWRARGFSPWPNTARMCGLL